VGAEKADQQNTTCIAAGALQLVEEAVDSHGLPILLTAAGRHECARAEGGLLREPLLFGKITLKAGGNWEI
jgi:hypothetical protein